MCRNRKIDARKFRFARRRAYSQQTMNLIRTIYVSTASPDLGPDGVADIMEVAVRTNLRLGITGMLILVDGCFMQVIEGQEDVIDAMMLRLFSDPRHSGVTVLVRETIESRSFSRWSMGFRRVESEEAARNPVWAPLCAGGFSAEKAGASPGVALDMLLEFARLNAVGR